MSRTDTILNVGTGTLHTTRSTLSRSSPAWYKPVSTSTSSTVCRITSQFSSSSLQSKLAVESLQIGNTGECGLTPSAIIAPNSVLYKSDEGRKVRAARMIAARTRKRLNDSPRCHPRQDRLFRQAVVRRHAKRSICPLVHVAHRHFEHAC